MSEILDLLAVIGRLLRAENPVFLFSFGEGGSGSAAT